jgi:tripartite-type tricarboxylate transporter receptor subunit TctC
MLKTILKSAGTAIVALALAAPGAVADDYPSKAITLIIPLGAGGSHDLNARVFTSIIPQYLGQPVIVKLMPGASGQTGTAAAARARPDGYTLLFTHNYFDQLQQFVTKLPYDTMKDFTTVAMLNSAASCVATKPGRPFKTWPEMIAFAKANPGKIEMAHSGQWGAGMVHSAQIMKQYGITFNLTPYPGGGPAMKALLSDDADMTTGFPITITTVGSGVYPIACGASSPVIPKETPIYGKEIPELDGVGFMQRIVMAPKGVPEERLAKLRKAFQELKKDKTFTRLMSKLGEDTNIMDGPEYEKVRIKQTQEYKDLVAELTKKK